MTIMDAFSITGNIASIAMGIVSIWLGIRAVKDSQTNFERTSELLGKIDTRSAKTEAILGEHFSQLMQTMLTIVETATASPELRLAEVQRKEKEIEFKFQTTAMELVKQALESGNQERINQILTAFERMTRMSNDE